MNRSFHICVSLALVGGCATLGAQGEGDHDLPTAGVGPFRKLTADEVIGVAPFVLENRAVRYREPDVLALGDSVLLFAVGEKRSPGAAPIDVIVRSRANDARTFFGTTADSGRTPRIVLEPSLPWEAGALSGPSVLRAAGRYYLYYASKGGIGLARSDDGLSFSKEPAPVFVRDPSVTWETSEVAAPSVYLLPNGRFRMLYASGVCIGEAESDDGISFKRLDGDAATASLDPILCPSAPALSGTLLPGERGPFDTARVSDPCASLRTMASGRVVLRVLYTGIVPPSDDRTGQNTIGFAARFGDVGRLTRQALPVYSVGRGERAPAFVESRGLGFLYVEQQRPLDGVQTISAIAAAVAPATSLLGTPGEFPSEP